MGKASFAALFALSLTSLACSARNPIDAGSYTSHAGIKLDVTADKQAVTFTLPGGATVKRSATVWEQARWPMLCPRGMKDTRSEVLDLGPEPLELAGTKIERPVLVANCLHKPILELMTRDAKGEIVKPEVAAFER